MENMTNYIMCKTRKTKEIGKRGITSKELKSNNPVLTINI